MKSKLKKLFFTSTILGILFICFSYFTVRKTSKPFITDNLAELNNCKAALVLGTVKSLSNGYPNLYFNYRIQAAAELYKSGKVKYLIVSGDNSRKDYNEPEDMMLALIALGVPKEAIIQDFAGLRTLDSIVRCKEIFGQNGFIIVSQKFHNERAVYIARKQGYTVQGFNAKDVNKRSGFKTNLREVFARVKLMLDTYILNTQPKYLGEKVELI